MFSQFFRVSAVSVSSYTAHASAAAAIAGPAFLQMRGFNTGKGSAGPAVPAVDGKMKAKAKASRRKIYICYTTLLKHAPLRLSLACLLVQAGTVARDATLPRRVYPTVFGI